MQLVNKANTAAEIKETRFGPVQLPFWAIFVAVGVGGALQISALPRGVHETNTAHPCKLKLPLMGTWSGRKASSRTRAFVFIALGTVLLSTYVLFRLQLRRTAHVGDPARNPLPSTPVQAPQPNKDDKDADSLPPMYPELKVEELALPQHDEDLPFPEGKNAKFVRFGNQMWGVGLNNQLFEM